MSEMNPVNGYFDIFHQVLNQVLATELPEFDPQSYPVHPRQLL
jgi:hypothetical protein